MGMNQVVRCALFTAILLAALAACVMPPPREVTVTPDMRVAAFLADLNAADHSTVYLNLDPAVQNYNSMKTFEYWDVFFPVVGPGDDKYSYTDLVIGAEDEDGVITVTATLCGDPDTYGSDKPLVMTLVLVDFDEPYESWWMIETMMLGTEIVVLGP